MPIVELLILVSYVSLVIELVFFPVPSVASTYQLVYKTTNTEQQVENQGALGTVKKKSALNKLVTLILPAIINIFVFLAPLIILVVPAIKNKLFYLYQPTTLIITIGLLFIFLGRLITFNSVLQIRKNNTQKADTFDLKQSGWFSWSRNPGLVGMYLFGLGLFVVFPSLFLVIGYLFYLNYMHYKVRLEEDFLTNYYGSDYSNYMKQTARYLKAPNLF